MDQLTARDLVLVGLVAQAVLALLFALVWRRLHNAWAGWLALGLAANAATYAIMLAGLYREALHVSPARPVALLGVLAVVLITAGVIDYVGVPAPWARRLNGAAIAVAVASVVLGLTGGITRASGYAVMSLYVLAWVGLFGRAMWRERRSGHGFVVIALLLYPLSVFAIVLGWIEPELLSVSAVLPFSVLGATLLTTGLLRAHRSAALALAEREQAQVLLRAAHDSLEHQVALRTAELRETIDGLASFNRSVSHDLRAPLGGIVGVARLARQRLDSGDSAQAQRLLTTIEGQAINSVKLVEALLALARASDATLNVREVDSAELVSDVIQALPADAAPMFAVASGMPRVQADPDLLRQVFANLIGNALKFASPGRPLRVQVGSASPVGGERVFWVRDNGVGFDPLAAGRLFKPFQRLHDLTADGFGVGLSIVKRIVDRHGGRVWAEGRPGEGASFYFTLGPAATPPA